MSVAVAMVVAMAMGQGEADQASDHHHSRHPREKSPLENGEDTFLTFEAHFRMAVMAYSYSWLKFVVALRQMLPSPSEINRGLQSQSPASKKLPTVALSV